MIASVIPNAHSAACKKMQAALLFYKFISILIKIFPVP